MRTFVRLRRVVNADRVLERRIAELEAKYDGKFNVVFDAIRELMFFQAIPQKRIIGLGRDDG